MTGELAVLRIDVAGEAIQPGDARFLETARWMAHEYAAGVAAMRAAVVSLHEAGERIMEAFARAETERGPTYNRFEVEVRYDHSTTRFAREGEDPLAEIEKKMRRNAWALLIDHLGIKPLMSVKKRTEFEKSLDSGDLPEVTEDAILATVTDLIGKVREFALEAAKEAFEILRPAQWGQGAKYVTNDAFRVGRRVVLPWYIDRFTIGGKYRVDHGHEGRLNAVDSVFHLLDGKGPIKERVSPLVEAIRTAPDGVGETDYFKFRAFKNGNLHLGFKRLDLVKELNFQGAGERVLGKAV